MSAVYSSGLALQDHKYNNKEGDWFRLLYLLCMLLR
jgi:hypothetical protein